MKRNASTVGLIRHILPSMRKELYTKNGIVIPTKKILGYAANVIEICYITMPFLQFMFVEVFVWTELQSEFVLSMATRQ
jgi:hypothetical protein